MTKRTDVLDWQSYFMAVAQVSALRSKDPTTQVGAIVVNNLNHIVATGYNGFPRGVDDDKFPWERESDQWGDTKYPYVAHAELNAIVSARTDLTGCDLYVTLFPCNECAKIIIQAGIKRVFFLEDKYPTSKEAIAARRLLDEVSIPHSAVQIKNLTIAYTPGTVNGR